MLLNVMIFVVGVYAGVMLMCVMHLARDPLDVDFPSKCSGNCNQGRTCTCWKVRQQFDDESA